MRSRYRWLIYNVISAGSIFALLAFAYMSMNPSDWSFGARAFAGSTWSFMAIVTAAMALIHGDW